MSTPQDSCHTEGLDGPQTPIVCWGIMGGRRNFRCSYRSCPARHYLQVCKDGTLWPLLASADPDHGPSGMSDGYHPHRPPTKRISDGIDLGRRGGHIRGHFRGVLICVKLGHFCKHTGFPVGSYVGIKGQNSEQALLFAILVVIRLPYPMESPWQSMNY